MLEGRAHTRLRQGQAALGVQIPWYCPDMVEFLGYTGFDWIFIDAEHGVIGPESCQHMVRACNLTGMTPIVRVPDKDPGTILVYLESGALGIIAPHINTADDARAMVAASKYAPLGKRGAGSTTRAANYGLTQTAAKYFAEANEHIILVALVEERAGIENLDDILSVEGVDAVAIGPGDLAMSMGLPGQSTHPEVQKLIGDAEARIIASGKILTPVVMDAVAAQSAVARGAGLVAISITALLSNATHAVLEAARIT